jgi:hypothetical protein
MPRKSRTLRLQQAQALEAAWAESPFINDYRHRFIRDMIARLERDRGTSAKQRNWLDTLIEEGVPAAENKNPKLVAQIDAAIAAFTAAGASYDWERNVLVDMRPRVLLGKAMSEKQTGLLTRLCFTGEQLANGNVWTPSDEVKADIEIAVRLYSGYTSLWRNDRPAVYRAVEETLNFLSGNSLSLKKSSAEKLLNAVAGRLKNVKNPRWKSGDVGKKVLTAWNQSEHRHETVGVQRLVCMSDVYVTEDGAIVNDWLFPTGELKTLSAEKVSKR